MRIAARPISVEGFRRPAPGLLYGNNVPAKVDDEKVDAGLVCYDLC